MTEECEKMLEKMKKEHQWLDDLTETALKEEKKLSRMIDKIFKNN